MDVWGRLPAVDNRPGPASRLHKRYRALGNCLTFVEALHVVGERCERSSTWNTVLWSVCRCWCVCRLNAGPTLLLTLPLGIRHGLWACHGMFASTWVVEHSVIERAAASDVVLALFPNFALRDYFRWFGFNERVAQHSLGEQDAGVDPVILLMAMAPFRVEFFKLHKHLFKLRNTHVEDDSLCEIGSSRRLVRVILLRGELLIGTCRMYGIGRMLRITSAFFKLPRSQPTAGLPRTR